jgi:GT2 family glycosyltransferase
MNISVIVPARNAAATLGRCLAAVATSTRPPCEVLVVDDGSTDATAELAGRLGARVLRTDGGPLGPAAARNRGGESALSEILVFLDADVAVHPEALDRIARELSDHREVAAVFGSYDDDPPAPGLASRYKNLVHYYTHQASRPEASTFWAGCGAIRREVFLACKGFDEAYSTASIEDIELGVRLRAAGHRIRLCPDVQGTHLKHWSFVGLVRTDILHRAIPWSLLIRRHGSMPDDLNLARSSRVAALAAWAAVVCLPVGLGSPWCLVGSVLALVVVVACNAGLLALLARRGGPALLVVGFGLHWLYLLYSSAVFAVIVGPAWLERLLARRSRIPALAADSPES